MLIRVIPCESVVKIYVFSVFAAIIGFMVTLTDIQQKRADILRIAASHGASEVRLFGSVVRGTAGDGSDLDILVKMAPDRSLLDRIAISQDLEDLLHVKVDVVNEKALAPSVRRQVLREGICDL